MTTKTDLMPLPAEHYVDDEGLWEKRYGPYSPEQMEDYARANVEHATAQLQAEVEVLWAEVEALREALKEIRSHSSMIFATHPIPFELTALLGDIYQIAVAALGQEEVE